MRRINLLFRHVHQIGTILVELSQWDRRIQDNLVFCRTFCQRLQQCLMLALPKQRILWIKSECGLVACIQEIIAQSVHSHVKIPNIYRFMEIFIGEIRWDIRCELILIFHVGPSPCNNKVALGSIIKCTENVLMIEIVDDIVVVWQGHMRSSPIHLPNHIPLIIQMVQIAKFLKKLLNCCCVFIPLFPNAIGIELVSKMHHEIILSLFFLDHVPH
mmetsp:Transcript_3580/g.13698  ORF Transcript_3580/g.13698 Transcript_3580/m.13698 type:complete len:215 (+) Transcript_3580:696-1340(+)